MSFSPHQPDLDQLFADADWLRGLALHLAGSEDRADDLAQETWLAALQRKSNSALHPRSWLAGVARNLQNLGLRREGRRKKREQGLAQPLAAPPEDALLRLEMQKKLADALLRLDRNNRQLVVWKYFDQLSNHQIAARLDVDVVVVRQRLSRARKRLRACLQSDFGSDWGQQLLVAFSPTQLVWKATLGSFFMKINTKVALGFLLLLAIPLMLNWDPEDAAATPQTTENTLAKPMSVDSDPLQAPIDRVALEDNTGVAAGMQIDNESQLSGLVIDGNDRPVPHATVSAILPVHRQIPTLSDFWSLTSEPVQTLATNAEGKFSFMLPRNKVYDLIVEAAGFANLRAFDHIAGEHIVLQLAPGATVVGTIADEDTSMPVANVIVRLTPGYPRQGNLRYEAISDQDGKYQILNLPPGDYNLRVQSATHPPSPQRSAKFNFNTLLSGEYRERDLVLRAGSVISGTVTNAELKTPIAGAKVKLGITSDQPEVTTDADGYFELLSSPGYENQSLTVRAKDFGNFSVKVFQVPEDGVEVFVALLPARKASGRVVDQHGNPIGEVHICASAYDHSPQHGEQIENLRTMTQPDGTFEIRNLRQDLRHSLLLGHQDYATAIFDFPLEEWDGMQLELGDLPMEPPASIQGRVVDLEDMPLPHLWVLLSGEPAHRDDLGPSQDPGQGYLAREGMGFGRISARTNSDGRFVFSNLPSGQYWLSAGAKGYAKRGNLELSLKPGEEKDQVEIKFDRGLAIQGVVVNSKGDPLPEASVTIHQPNSFNQLSYTLCDSQGKFEIWGIPAGEYRLTASSGFRRRTELAGTPLFWEMIQEGVAAGTGGMRIELPDLGQLRGKVLGPNGVPVKGALVSVSFEREGFGPTAVTLPDGSFTILAPTNRSLFIQAYPPNQNDNGAFAPIIDDTGKVDMSYFSTEVRASGGSPELTLHLPKLILGSGE